MLPPLTLLGAATPVSLCSLDLSSSTMAPSAVGWGTLFSTSDSMVQVLNDQLSTAKYDMTESYLMITKVTRGQMQLHLKSFDIYFDLLRCHINGGALGQRTITKIDKSSQIIPSGHIRNLRPCFFIGAWEKL